MTAARPILVTRLLALLVMALGLAVILGWHLHVPAVIQVLPSFVPMQYNTALGLLLSGLGLHALIDGRHCVTALAGAAVALIGILTLVEYSLALDLGIDQLLMNHYITVGTPHPGRMAPNTAICFGLTGSILLLVSLGRGRWRWSAGGILAAVVAGLGGVALIGYFIDIPTAYGWGSYTRMAAHTALAFIAVGGGLIAFLWGKETAGPDWIPIAIGLLGATIAFTSWQALHAGISEGLFARAADLALLTGLAMALAFAGAVRASRRASRLALALAADIDQRKAAEGALRLSEERLRTILDGVDSYIYLKDTEGRYLFANAAVLRLWGVELQDLVGSGDERFLDAETVAGIQRNDRRVLVDGEVLRAEETNRVAETGESKTYLSVKLPLRHADGSIYALCGISTDITERIAAEQEVRNLNVDLERRVTARTAELSAANRELDAFAYAVSHDLRTPLRAVDGFSAILLKAHADRLDDQGRDLLQRMGAAAQRMGLLIDDMLALSRIGRAELQRERCDLSSLAESAVAQLRESFPGRRVEVSIEPGLTVDADPRLVRIMLDNLLGNAWKFTAKTPEARVELRREEHEGRAQFIVRDNGAGFDMAYAGKLFGPFQRLHGASEFPGSGIGLATVMRVIRKHGGQVSAEGTVGRGACFWFTLGP